MLSDINDKHSNYTLYLNSHIYILTAVLYILAASAVQAQAVPAVQAKAVPAVQAQAVPAVQAQAVTADQPKVATAAVQTIAWIGQQTDSLEREEKQEGSCITITK